MARPDLAEVLDQPVFNPSPPNRFSQVESALRNLEQGQFMQAALLVDAMLRDDRIASCLETRINGLLGCDLTMDPVKDTARARKVAEDIDASWMQMFDTASLAEVCKWGLMINAAPTENLWERDTAPWDIKKLKTWHPYYLQYDYQKRDFLINAAGGERVPVTSGDGKWGLYCPYGEQRAWMGGLVRSLAYKWLIRNSTYQDFARWCEANGTPMVLIKYPSGDAKEAKQLQARIARRGTEMSLALPQTKDGVSFEVEYLEANGLGYQGFETLLKSVDEAIAIRLLGQSMSTTGQSGLGSQENAGDSVRIDLKRADNQKFSEFIRKNILMPYALYNYGDADLAPWPHWQVAPPEDTAKTALTYKTLADSLVSFQATGAPVDVRQLLEDNDVPLLSEADAAAKAADDAAQAAEAMASAQAALSDGAVATDSPSAEVAPAAAT